MPLRPVEHALLKGTMFGYDTYEVYAADSKEEALHFLNGVTVIEDQYYVVVETPTAIVAKDLGGIYRPSKTWRGDSWVSQKWNRMVGKERRQHWRHWNGVFDDVTAASSPGTKTTQSWAELGDQANPKPGLDKTYSDNRTVTFSIDAGLKGHCAECGHKLQEPVKETTRIQVRRRFTPFAFFIGFAASIPPLAAVSGLQTGQRTPDWFLGLGIVVCGASGTLAMDLWNFGMPDKHFQISFCSECQRRYRRFNLRVILLTLALLLLPILILAATEPLHLSEAVKLVVLTPMLVAMVFVIFIFWTFMVGDKKWFSRRRVRITISDKTRGLLQAKFGRRAASSE